MKDLQAPKEDIITAKAVMDWLDISRYTLYRLRKQGVFKSYKIAGKLFFKRHEIVEAIEASEEQN